MIKITGTESRSVSITTEPIELFRGLCAANNLETAIFPTSTCYCIEQYDANGKLIRLTEVKNKNETELPTGRSISLPSLLTTYEHLKALKELMGFGPVSAKKVSP